MEQPVPDLFDKESRALLAAQTVHARAEHLAPKVVSQALGGMIEDYQRLLRETRRLIRHSDRVEREMALINQRLQSASAELQYRATHDPLTGVLNRSAIIDRVNEICPLHALSLIVLDIDHFKRINDSFGHPIGDQVIVQVVDCLTGVIPSSASIGRVGGEEFTVALPGQSIGATLRLAASMCQAVAHHDHELPDHSRVTASLGVSWLPSGGTFDEAYCLADEALNSAKRAGRNCVRHAEVR
ncbi:MAG: GGDEF domain-containing protein, partial [Alcaligenaceae bacterium]